MKQFVYLSIAFLSFTMIKAQHSCSQHKIKNGLNKSVSVALPPGYIPPENSYDLKFYYLNLNSKMLDLLYLLYHHQ